MLFNCLDMRTAYTESSKMNHHFRVLETVVLRIKRPEAICTIEGAPAVGGKRAAR